MAKVLSVMCIGYLLSISVFAAEAKENTGLKVPKGCDASLELNFDLTKKCLANIEDASTKCSAKIAKALSWLLLPGALFCDAICCAQDAMVSPFVYADLALKKLKESMSDYSAKEMFELALQGYGKRIDQIKPFLADRDFTPLQINSLAFACTAWDSRQCEESCLIFGSGAKLKRSVITKHETELAGMSSIALSMFDDITKAKLMLKDDPSLQFASFDEFMRAMVEVIASKDKPNNSAQQFISRLEEAAQGLQTTLNGLLAR